MARRGTREFPMRCSAFGLDITSAMPLPGTWRCADGGRPGLSIEPADAAGVAHAWTGAASLGWQGRVDGLDLCVEHGNGGDLRLRLAEAADLHLSPDGSRLLVAAAGDPVTVTRLLLDSALFTISLRHGYEALHAGAVLTDRGVVAVTGDTGAGKSSLVAALLAAGCAFFTDDVLVLHRRGPAIVAVPGPPVMTAPSPVPHDLGEPLAEIGDETWLAVAGAASERALVAIIRLETAGRAVPAFSRVLGDLLRFPRTPERELARFDLAAELDARVPVRRMDARRDSPDRMAADVLDWLPSLPES